MTSGAIKTFRRVDEAWIHADICVVLVKVSVIGHDTDTRAECWCDGGSGGGWWAWDGTAWVQNAHRPPSKGLVASSHHGSGWQIDKPSQDLLQQCQKLADRGHLDELGKLPEVVAVYAKQESRT